MSTFELAREALIFACDTGTLGHDDGRLSRAAHRGILVRVKQGVYLPIDIWKALEPVEQHRLRLVTVERLSGPGLVFSHESAAALVGLPVLGRWPDKAHVLRECAAGGRSNAGISRHSLGLAGVPISRADGLTFTAPARTVIDLATTMPFLSAVVAADAALRVDRRTGQSLTTPADVRSLLDAMMPFRGMRKVLSALDAATSLSDSVGETVCRLILLELGFAPAALQSEFRDGRGLIGYVDFTWRRSRVLLEFDGAVKYTDPRYTHGLTVSQIVMREKNRENRLRALGFRVVRTDWHELQNPALLLRTLRDAGLEPVNPTTIIRRPWL
ncbi:hypothetical protein [Glaciibacter sp. 2TAF33]|uniref:hypothetical protein n=1 Tax=Glaciibacter sp. 2TAF33 TaxID=3233015 RepID=UPI003F8EE79E